MSSLPNDLAKLSLENRLIGGKYRLVKPIGNGSFGVIYHAFNIQGGKAVAVKIESSSVENPILRYEMKIYKKLGEGLGFPKIYHFGNEGQFNAMVMEMLGPSLEDCFAMCKRRFSMKTIVMLWNEMLLRLEEVHSRCFIHRDIKPENFLMGVGPSSHKLYITDFGLSKQYMDPTCREHIPYRESRRLVGTVRYASINTQRGAEQSRRDDLESLSYCIMYFMMGRLPWQGLPSCDKKQKYERICELKKSLCIDDALKEWPIEFTLLVKYTRNLRFLDQPDYLYMHQLLKSIFHIHKFKFDSFFDWHIIQREKEREKAKLRRSKLDLSRRALPRD